MTVEQNRFDVIVIGGGIMGAATAEALVRRGKRVLVVDRFGPAHRHGSSHGDGRIIRYTYPDAVYVDMARLAFPAWQRLERLTGASLIETTGTWDCGPADSPELNEIEVIFQQSGVSYERLDAGASGRRFPHFELPAGSFALYQADGGIVRAGRAVETLWQLLRQRQATVIADENIVAIEADDDGVEVTSATGRSWRAAALVVTAGGWSSQFLAKLGVTLPLTVTLEQVAYFPQAGSLDHSVGSMPTLIDYHRSDPFYALPHIEVPGVKVGWHHGGAAIDAERPDEEAARGRCQEILHAIRDYVRQRLPGLSPEPSSTLTCLYTNTPDYHFVLDRHPRLANVVIGAGFSGHGFKFAPVIGDLLAALVSEESPIVPLDLFRIDRFDSED